MGPSFVAFGLLASWLVTSASGKAADGSPCRQGEADEDETSFLQVSISGHGQALSESANDTRQAMPDIPERDIAWALFQRVAPGPPSPQSLSNDTEIEPPGVFSNHSLLLKRKIAREDYQTYSLPKNDPSLRPDWVSECIGDHRTVLNNLSGWIVEVVPVPQLIPFVVPNDHPHRSDVSVVIAPGGGGQFLAWEAEGTDVAKAFNYLGISAFVLKYRVPAQQDLPSNWSKTDAVLDAQRAIMMVRHMAPAYGLNASRVGMFGSSHGGFVAVMATFAFGRQYAARDSVDLYDPSPDFLILLYPELFNIEDLEAAASMDESYRDVDGLQLGNLSNPPPVFLAHGADDLCVDVNSVYRFHGALRQRADPPVELNIFANVGHGFSMCWRMYETGWEAFQHEACLWMLRARRFIHWQVEHKPPANTEQWFDQLTSFDEPPSFLTVKTSGGAARAR